MEFNVVLMMEMLLTNAWWGVCGWLAMASEFGV